MRPALIGVCAVCLLTTAAGAAEPTGGADAAASMQAEAVGDRWPDRWQGRQHYLYDEQSMPVPNTDGARRGADAQACAREPVRTRRGDGSTTLTRVNRCD